MSVKKWIAKLLAAAMCCSLLAIPVSAYERINTEQEASLALHYHDAEREKDISGMEIRLYKVADMSDSVRFTVTEDFADASVFRDESFALEELDTEKWAALADTLTAYIALERTEGPITPAASGVTDGEGKVSFAELEVGLYLLEGDKAVDGNYTYIPAHYLLTLPALNTETDQWEYDVLGGNKYTRRYQSGGGGSEENDDGEKISRNVLKVWEGDEAEERPQSVTVQLLCNGTVYDTVTLSEENNWKHSWVGLDAEADWKLVEADVPEGYTVLVEQEGNTFVVTNTFEEDIPDGDIPTGDKESGDGEDEEEVLEEDIPLGGLPQTGVLWWPVQVLAAIGIMLFALGWADGRKKGSEDA